MCDLGHWKFDKEFEPEDGWYGMIYLIMNKITGQKYIGKKAFFSVRRIKQKDKTRRKVVRKDSGWREYMGSSRWLLEDIEKYGKDNFEFHIISLWESKAAWTYEEARCQFELDVLRTKINGDIPAYYNRQITGSIKYIPPEMTAREREMRVEVKLLK